jgi:integrase
MYIHRFKDRHGHVRHYFRRPGCKQVALPGLPGSAEFMAAYQAALAGEPMAPGASRVAAGTISALVVQWYQSAGFRQLSPSTKATYRGIVERFRAEHGEKRVAMLEATHIRRLIAAKTDTPAAANNLLSLIRLLMRFAVEEDWRRDDPTLGVRKIRFKTEGFHTWTEDEIKKFEAKWPVGTRERLAFALLLHTGQRRSDVIRMGRQHVRDRTIDVVQQKTGTRLALPLSFALREALAACPSDQLTFLVTKDGAPFTAAGFTNWFRDSCNAAELPKGCSPHGLRKAAARRLAEAGCSASAIAAVTGHRTLSEVSRYTRAADQGRLAETAMEAVGRRKSNEA